MSRKGAFVIAGGVVVLVGMLAAAAIHFGPLISQLWRESEPEFSARYYPADTLAYGWFTLTPAGEQAGHFRELWVQAEGYRAIEEGEDELDRVLLDQTGASLEEWLRWAGPEFSVGLLELDGFGRDFDAVMTVQVRDAEKAKDFLRELIDHRESWLGAHYDREREQDVEIWYDRNGDGGFALSDSVLVMASTERALRKVTGLVSGERGSSNLSETGNFREARGTTAT